MQNFDEHYPLGAKSEQAPLSLSDAFHILRRHRLIIGACVITFFVVAVVYSLLVTPIFKASTLIKKESTENRQEDNLTRIIELETSDAVETEVELLKTRTVLDKVVDELGLAFKVLHIDYAQKADRDYDKHLVEYQQNYAAPSGGRLPSIKVLSTDVPLGFEGHDYYVQVMPGASLALYDAEDDTRISVQNTRSPAEFKLSHFHIVVNWIEMEVNSRLYFRLEGPAATYEDLSTSISVVPVKATTLFKVSVESPSPFMSQLIANTVAEKYRETRYEHKRQSISYSFDFVDRQLDEVSENLRDAEAELSQFKSDNKIVMLDKNSEATVQALSELEAEKVRTDLELAEYRNKYTALKEEMAEKGFFDQTHLAPTENERQGSPFSSLLQELSRVELRRLEMLQKRTENHPDIIALDDQVAEIKDKLSSYNQNTISAYDIIIKSRMQKQRDLAKLIERYSDRIEDLPEHEVGLMRLVRQKNVYEKVFNLLLDKREEMRMAQLSRLQDIVIVDPAFIPAKPVSPNKRLNVIAGTILGLMLGLMLALLKEFQSQTIQTADEIERKMKLPILAIFPRYKKDLQSRIKEGGFNLKNHLQIFTKVEWGFIESYRLMRTRVQQLPPDRNTIFITSCEENTGKTTIITIFALTMALSGKKVLLIDGDLKKSTLGDFFKLKAKKAGLIPYLTGEAEQARLFSLKFRSGQREAMLKILPCGGVVETSSELLDSPKFRDLLKEYAEEYDYVLIDTPPVTRTVDSLVLANFVDDAIMIARPGLTLRKSLIRAAAEFRNLGTNLLGVVINASDLNPGENGYGYGYGYGYANPQIDISSPTESAKSAPKATKIAGSNGIQDVTSLEREESNEK